jgi:DNA-binding CsgD family transcriptional regulator
MNKGELSSFESLIARYGITQREREIIKEVCSGKSNQEIADALFISLQTVKDHTHRIYLKMGIKRRVQLIKLMQLK